MTRIGSTVISGLAGLALAGCVSVGNAYSGIHADPVMVERWATNVFERYRIPVADWSVDGQVYSGVFIANERWSPETVVRRVDCGRDAEGRPLVGQNPVQLAVTLHVAERRDGTELRLASQGGLVARPGRTESGRCALSDAFSRELLRAVAGAFPGSDAQHREVMPVADVSPFEGQR